MGEFSENSLRAQIIGLRGVLFACEAHMNLHFPCAAALIPAYSLIFAACFPIASAILIILPLGGNAQISSAIIKRVLLYFVLSLARIASFKTKYLAMHVNRSILAIGKLYSTASIKSATFRAPSIPFKLAQFLKIGFVHQGHLATGQVNLSIAHLSIMPQEASL